MRTDQEHQPSAAPIDPALEDLSRDLVKCLLAAGDSYEPGIPPAVQHSLTLLCSTAHNRGVSPESVLALLKRTWKAYVSDAEGGFAAREIWYGDLITRCIHDFYEAN